MRRLTMALILTVLPLMAAGRGKVKLRGSKARQGAPDDGSVPPRFLQQVRTGRTSKAEQWLAQARERHPDSLDLLTAQAVIHTAHNEHWLAIPLYEQSLGSAFYERAGIRFHADSLSQLGDGVRASQLRTRRLHRDDYSHQQVQYENITRIHDARDAQDYLLALDACDAAVGHAPHSGSVYAACAEVFIDMGDLEAASFQLLLSRERNTSRTGATQAAIAEARWLMANDQPEQAVLILREFRQRNRTNERYWAVLSDALAASGRPREATWVLRDVMFRRSASGGIRARRARLELRAGNLPEARRQLDALLTDMPGNPDGVAVFAELSGTDG